MYTKGIKNILQGLVEEDTEMGRCANTHIGNLMSLALSEISPANNAMLYLAGSRTGAKFANLLEVYGEADMKNKIKTFFENSGFGYVEFQGDSIKVVERPHYGNNEEFVGKEMCHFKAGFFAGTFSKLHGTGTLCSETKCRAKGDEYCEFEIIRNV